MELNFPKMIFNNKIILKLVWKLEEKNLISTELSSGGNEYF